MAYDGIVTHLKNGTCHYTGHLSVADNWVFVYSYIGWNRFEAGNMEQIFKMNQADVKGIEAIDTLLNEDFIKKVIARFNEMFLSFKELGNSQ